MLALKLDLPWLLLLVCVIHGRGDLPVHCLRHQVAGTWEFTLGPLGPERTGCGHQRPDDEEKQPGVMLSQVAGKKVVRLRKPNVAVSDQDPAGSWTMIYDEGFEVKVEGLSFFAFSRFDLKFQNGQKTNTSHCDQTQLGWYHKDDRTGWGCYYGRKLPEGPDTEQSMLNMRSFAPGPARKSAHYDKPLDAEYHRGYAEQLNMLQGDWVAKAHDMFAGKSMRAMNQMAGLLRSLPLSLHWSSEAPPNEGISLVQTRELRRSKLISRLGANRTSRPSSWDWGNVNGKNYLEEILDQGQCGSCYTVSTMRMLSARHKIARDDPSLEPFSIEFPLRCSEYNQGCGGGYAFLTSKWSHDVGLVPESCGRQARSGKCSPSCDMSKLEKRFRADNYHYVGGYYGGANEEEILEELHQRGPVVVSFEPKNDLMYYGGGIYRSSPNVHSEWERVDHAVLLVGWGEEAGKKYWLLQNSWGPDWGEKGFFRMARGENDSGIESIAVAANVVEDERPNVLMQLFEENTGN